MKKKSNLSLETEEHIIKCGIGGQNKNTNGGGGDTNQSDPSISSLVWFHCICWRVRNLWTFIIIIDIIVVIIIIWYHSIIIITDLSCFPLSVVTLLLSFVVIGILGTTHLPSSLLTSNIIIVIMITILMMMWWWW